MEEVFFASALTFISGPIQREPDVLVVAPHGGRWGQIRAWAAQDYTHPLHLRFHPSRAMDGTWQHHRGRRLFRLSISNSFRAGFGRRAARGVGTGHFEGYRPARSRREEGALERPERKRPGSRFIFLPVGQVWNPQDETPQRRADVCLFFIKGSDCD